MEDDIINELMHIWKKPEVNKVSKANFIRELLQETKLSQRQFATKYKIPISTLKGWLVYNKITHEQLDKLKSEGINARTIHESLKRTTRELPINNFQYDLERCISILRPYLKNIPNPENGTALKLSYLKEIIDKLNRGV